MPESTASNTIALDVARILADSGVPLFLAPPCQHGGAHGDWDLPPSWQTTDVRAAGAVLDAWRPGMALCAVMGHTLDVLDVDPRNGGADGMGELEAAGAWPDHLAVTQTPSGGEHYFIASLGRRKGKAARGVDYQGGAPDGQGRGFVFLPPTVRTSRVDGQARRYEWVIPPGNVDLREERRHGAPGPRAVLAARLDARDAPVAAPAGGGDPFVSPGPVGVPASLAEVNAHIAELAAELAAAPDGTGNDTAARLAWEVGQYVGAGQVDAHDARDRLWAEVDATWSWRRPTDRNTLYNTITSQIRAGSQHPRAWMSSERVATPVEEDAAPVGTPNLVDQLLSRMLDRDALDTIVPPDYLVDGLLDLDSESWIIGAPGSYKSFVALDIAAHVALGLEWRGRRVNRHDVVYVAAEGQKGIPGRVRAWEAVYGHRIKGMRWLPEPVQVMGETTARDGQPGLAWRVLVEACRRLAPGLIVLDTQARITVGMEENSNTSMGVLIEAVRALKVATGACVLVVHHTGRNGRDARGASALDGAQDTEIRIDRDEDPLTATIALDKQKDGDESLSWEISMRVVDAGCGRTSLALEPLDPFSPARAAPEPDWIRNATPNQAEVYRAMRAHGDHYGATRAQVQRWVNERRRADGVLAPLIATSLDTAVRELVARETVVYIGAKLALVEHIEAHEREIGDA